MRPRATFIVASFRARGLLTAVLVGGAACGSAHGSSPPARRCDIRHDEALADGATRMVWTFSGCDPAACDGRITVRMDGQVLCRDLRSDRQQRFTLSVDARAELIEAVDELRWVRAGCHGSETADLVAPGSVLHQLDVRLGDEVRSFVHPEHGPGTLRRVFALLDRAVDCDIAP